MSFEFDFASGDLPSLEALDAPYGGALDASLIQTSATLEERLDTLGTRVNELYAAAWGRGLAPLVAPALADKIAAFQNAFRAWRDSLGLLAVLNVSADTVARFNQWETDYNALRSQLPDEKKPPAISDNTLIDWGPVLKWGAIAIGGIAVLALITNIRALLAPVR